MWVAAEQPNQRSERFRVLVEWVAARAAVPAIRLVVRRELVNHENSLCRPASPRLDQRSADRREQLITQVSEVIVDTTAATAVDTATSSTIPFARSQSARPGAVWVATPEGRVDCIDPRRNRLTARIRVRGRGPSKIAFGFGSVWVLTPLVRLGRPSGTLLSRIDPRTNRVVDTTSLAGPAGEITPGDGAVWVSAGRVDAVDPRSGRLLGRPVPLVAGNLAAGTGAVWATGASGRLNRIDPESHAVRGKPIVVGASADRVAVGDGFVWVTDSVRSTLVRVRP